MDLPYKLRRLRALEALDGPRTPRPPSLIETARRRRIAALNRLTMADVPRVEWFGLHRVPQDVADEIALLRAVRETVAKQAIAAEDQAAPVAAHAVAASQRFAVAAE